MAQTLKLKRSAVSGNTPTTSDLALGEIAINTYDGNIFIKKNDGTESIVTFSAGGNAGSIEEDSFTGDGSTVAFTISTAPSTEENLLVFIDAAFQNRDSFTISGTTVTFDTAPDNTSSVRIYHVIPGTVDDGILTVAKFAASAIVTEGEGIASNDNDTTIPTSAAVKDYVDTQVATVDTLPEVLANGNTTGGTDISVSTGDDITFADSSKAIFGTDSDLELYHNGSNAFLTNTTGDLYIQDTNGSIRIRPKTGESGIDVLADGAVNLYYDNTSVLSTTADGISVTSEVEANEFIGDLRGAVLFKAQAGEDLTKGDIVYISGISGNTTVVSKAKADDASKMPAFGVASATASNNSSVTIYTFGTLSSIDTSSFSEGDELFVSTTAGAFTNSAPTGESSQIQKIAKVTRSDSSAGSIKIMGAGRSNAVPNLDEDQFFLGNASNQAVATDFSDAVEALSINNVVEDTTPQLGGNLASNGNDILFADSDKAIFGTGSDLQIYHDGSNSYIDEVGTGNLLINANNLRLRDTSGNPYFLGNNGAEVRLYHNGSTKLQTTSTGIDVTGEVLADSLDIDGNGDISGNLTLGGYLAGPATFTIDPAAVGDNTGTVVIAGNLQVDGTTTTINSTTMTVDDLNLTLASGAANAAAANGAGLTVDCGSDTDATFTFNGTSAQWNMNTELNIQPRHTGGTPPSLYLGDLNNQYQSGIASSGHLTMRAGGSGNLYWQNGGTYLMMMTNAGDLSIGNGTSAPTNHRVHIKTAVDNSVAQGLVIERSVNTDRGYINYNGGGFQFRSTVGDPIVFGETDAEHMRILPDGNVGIGTSSPDTQLHFEGSAPYLRSKNTSAPTDEKTWDYNAGTDGTFRFRAVNDAATDANNWMVVDRTGVNINYITMSTGNQVEALRIDSSGTLGIKTIPKATNTFHADMFVGPSLYIANYSSGANQQSIFGNNTYYNSGYKAVTGDTAASMVNFSKGNIIFDTATTVSADAAQSFTTKFYIKNDGNVGIGTDDPDALLDIEKAASGTSFVPYLQLGQTYTVANSKYGIDFKNTEYSWNQGRISVERQGSAANFDMILSSAGGGSLVEGIRIDHAGNVGIGTTNPQTKLHVEGLLRITESSNTAFYEGASVRVFGSGQQYGFRDSGGTTKASISMTGNSYFNGGNVGVGNTNPSAKFQVEEYGIDTTETSTTATTQVAIHTFAAATFRSARFTVQVTNSTDSTYHLTEILMIHDGTTPSITEYGTIFTGSAEATFDADISSGNVRLLATPASTDTMEFKVVAHSITT
jgi:hypothetical protein